MRHFLAFAAVAAVLAVPASAQAAPAIVVMHMETDPGPNIDVDALGGPPVRVSVVRGGQTLPGAQGQGQSVDLTNVAAQVGDQIVVEQPPGTVVGAAPYDELPTFDNPVCLGDTAETATVGDAMSVFGTAYTGLLTGTPPPAASSLGDGKATFTFGAPVSTGMFVQAETFRHLGSLDVNSERSVIARDCNSVAVPGLPPVPPPGPGVPGRVDSVPPLGLAHAPAHARVRDLLRRGLSFRLTVSEACRAKLAILLNGAVVARGETVAVKVGNAKVLLEPTSAGRRALRRAHRLRAAITGDLWDASGNKAHLGVKPFSLRR